MPPYSQFLTDSPSQGRSTYPCNRRNSLRPPSCQFMAFIGPRQRSGEKDKRESLRRPPVNLWLSSDRASGLGKKTKGTACAVPPVYSWLSSDRASSLGKRQKGQLAPSLLSICGFHRTAPAVWEKDKRDSLRRSPCQSAAFTGPRQRSEKKTKGTACAVPPVYGVIIKFR